MRDASFSFDGVIGAFAINKDIFIIMLGLGVGAQWVRSLTIYFVKRDTLSEYRYLEHGAHWHFILALAGLMFLSALKECPKPSQVDWLGLNWLVFLVVHCRAAQGYETIKRIRWIQNPPLFLMMQYFTEGGI